MDVCYLPRDLWSELRCRDFGKIKVLVRFLVCRADGLGERSEVNEPTEVRANREDKNATRYLAQP